MYPAILKTALTTIIFISSLMSIQANALGLNLNLEDSSALTRLTEADWTLLKSTAKDALNNSADGSSHVWKNPETSNAGVITILSTEETDNSYCRNTRFINTTGDLTSTTFVNLCKEEDKWAEASPRSTTTAIKNDFPSTSSSEILNDTPAASTEITKKTLGETSEYCRKLFQNIENLKGKPARRSAAIDLHKAECLR